MFKTFENGKMWPVKDNYVEAIVDIFKKERETDDPILGTCAYFSESEACES